MSDSTRQMGDRDLQADIHGQRTQFMPSAQMEQAEGQNAAPQAQQNDTEDNGTLEPRDSRNVTGVSGGSGIGTPGGSDQENGGQRWGGGQQGQSQTPNAAGYVDQQEQTEDVAFDADPALDPGEEVDFEPSSQMTQSQDGQQQQFQSGDTGGGQAGEIREHMEVIGADGVHLGTVDHLEGDRIKLTKADSGMGSHQGHHHYISRGLVAGVEGNQVRLSANADVAYGMEEEE